MNARIHVLLAALAAAPAFAKAPADIPVEDFFRRAQFSQVVLSPDGKRLAALAPVKGRDNVVVVDLEKRTRNVLTSFERADAYGIFWVNAQRLCFRAGDTRVESGEARSAGMYCVDADGKRLREGAFTPLAAIAADTEGEYMAGLRRRAGSQDVYRIDTAGPKETLLTWDTPGSVARWVLDRNLEPRIAVSIPEREAADKPVIATVWHRAKAGDTWEKLWQYDVEKAENAHRPIAFDYDNRTLFVSSSHGRDKSAIFTYDIAAKRLGDVVVEHPLIDVYGGLVFSGKRRKLVGVRLDADKPLVTWTDPELAAIQRAIDAALPRTFNSMQFSRDESRALVYAYSDTDPGGYYLYDAARKSLEPVARTREWLDPALMAERRFITYKARDGMVIPAWVTVPKGATGRLPLVVNIHGGPWTRGYHWAQWGRPVAQFLASRGYVVLEPEPRGSTGFGRRHYEASFRQWGRAMQDDITDGALHLVAEGLVDRGRMCLHGGSYGGYATLQGLVKDPDLWKCGSAYVAVADLGLMQKLVYSDTAQYSDFLQTDFKRMVGDSVADAELFAQVSPARNAARIKAKVLIAMGSNDARVPDKHGEVMRAALEAAGNKPEYVLYVGESHGFSLDANVFDHYRRVEKLLAETIGRPPP